MFDSFDSYLLRTKGQLNIGQITTAMNKYGVG